MKWVLCVILIPLSIFPFNLFSVSPPVLFICLLFPFSISFTLSNPFHIVTSLHVSVSVSSAFNSLCHLCVCSSCESVVRWIRVTHMFSSLMWCIAKCQKCVWMSEATVQRLKSQQNTFTLQWSVDVDWKSSEEWQAFITQWTLWTHILTPFLTVGLSLPFIY